MSPVAVLGANHGFVCKASPWPQLIPLSASWRLPVLADAADTDSDSHPSDGRHVCLPRQSGVRRPLILVGSARPSLQTQCSTTICSLCPRTWSPPLQQLRLNATAEPRIQRKLWADAICINQSDNAEKSHQVMFMREIYAKAQQGAGLDRRARPPQRSWPSTRSSGSPSTTARPTGAQRPRT